jgi:hypothetical protein
MLAIYSILKYDVNKYYRLGVVKILYQISKQIIHLEL